MSFFVVLLAYIIRRGLDGAERLNTDPLWRRCFHWGSRAPSGQEGRIWPGVLSVVVPALGLVAAGRATGSDGAGIALDVLVDLVLLVALMGASGWKDRLSVYGEAWQRGDMKGAWEAVRDCLPAKERGAAGAPDRLHLAFSAQFMNSVFERYFLIIFWYLAGGIGVAFLVRGVVALRDHWPQAAARPGFAAAVSILAWLPVRLLSFTFGLAGDLSGWLGEGRQSLLVLSEPPRKVLLSAADSALTGYALDPTRFAKLRPEEWLVFGRQSLEAIRDLLNRSMLVWICAMALLVILGALP